MAYVFKVLKESLHTIFPGSPGYLPKDYPDLTGKVVLITGCSAGVGKESAQLLLEQNATVVFANRSVSKTKTAIEEIKHSILQKNSHFVDEVLDKRIIPITIDLSDLTTIKPGVEELKTHGIDKLDIVILNAGVMQPPNDSITKQGWELQFGTNVIGHQLLIDLIHPLVLKAKSVNYSPRVIFLASASYMMSPSNGGLSWNFKDASWASSQQIYGQSKLANIYQAYIYGQDHKKEGIISLAVHPGFLNSELFRSLPSFIHPFLKYITYDPIYGAYTELFAALYPNITTEDNGRYIAPWGAFRDLIRPDVISSLTDGNARKMWDFVEEQIKEYS